METYIVIEIFDRNYPTIITNNDGFPVLFNTKEEAELEASECQNGIVVKY